MINYYTSSNNLYKIRLIWNIIKKEQEIQLANHFNNLIFVTKYKYRLTITFTQN